MGENGRAVAFHVLVEAQAKASLGQHTSKRGLAHFQGITPHVVALEGIVSKRKDSAYRSGRSPGWLKMKNPAAPAVKWEAEEDWGR